MLPVKDMYIEMKHQLFKVQMLLIIGGVEINPGPKTITQENPNERSISEESVGPLLLQEKTSESARTLRLLAACHSELTKLQKEVDTLTQQQQEDRRLIESLQIELTELKTGLHHTKAHTNQEFQHKNTELPPQPEKRVQINYNKCLQNVNNSNWRSVVNGLTDLWEEKPGAYAQMKQLGPGEQYPVLKACERGYTELIEALLDNGMDANTVAFDEYGDTLLHVAAQLGQLPLVRLLLTKKADLEQREQFGFTPIITAARAGQLQVVTLLAENGANINATTNNGHTSLHWAAFLGHSSVVLYLVEHGADPKIRDKITGQTAEESARAQGYHQIAHCIATHS